MSFRALPSVRHHALAAAVGCLMMAGCKASPLEAPAAEGRQTQRQLWVTNSQGNDVHVFEVGTWRPLRHLVVGPNPHGVGATADGRTVHITLEAFETQAAGWAVVWVDTRTGQITDRLALNGRPNEHKGTPDGKWLYVPNRTGGYWWVIDGEKKEVVKHIETGGGPHNTLISSNGQRMYLSAQLPNDRNETTASPRIGTLTIVDIPSGHEVVGKIEFSESLRPVAMTTNERLVFQNVNRLIGFEVADIQSRKVVARISHGIEPDPNDGDSRSHGISVRPDDEEVWSSYMGGQAHDGKGVVYVHELKSGEFKEIARIPMPGKVYWITMDPDSRFAYVSLYDRDQVAVVDTASKKILTLLDVGDGPKRTYTVNVPTELTN